MSTDGSSDEYSDSRLYRSDEDRQDKADKSISLTCNPSDYNLKIDGIFTSTSLFNTNPTPHFNLPKPELTYQVTRFTEG